VISKSWYRQVRDEHGARRIVMAASPKLAPRPLDHLRRMMGEWSWSVESSANLVVVAYSSGVRPRGRLGAWIEARCAACLGSVAGDDTVLVIVRKSTVEGRWPMTFDAGLA